MYARRPRYAHRNEVRLRPTAEQLAWIREAAARDGLTLEAWALEAALVAVARGSVR